MGVIFWRRCVASKSKLRKASARTINVKTQKMTKEKILANKNIDFLFFVSILYCYIIFDNYQYTLTPSRITTGLKRADNALYEENLYVNCAHNKITTLIIDVYCS
jgi:hypothetical protein